MDTAAVVLAIVGSALTVPAVVVSAVVITPKRYNYFRETDWDGEKEDVAALVTDISRVSIVACAGAVCVLASLALDLVSG